jgi:uncharacterized membrane protein YecN with MAPEG domain
MVNLGDGNIDGLQKATRAHANHIEYTPIFLILLLIAEMTSQTGVFLHVCCILLLSGRITHAYGSITKSGASWGRIRGSVATFTVLIFLSLWNLFVVVAKFI